MNALLMCIIVYLCMYMYVFQFNFVFDDVQSSIFSRS